MQWPKVSVIVLNYNGKRHLADCFGSLMEVDYPSDQLEIIFVDNASADDSVVFMREHFPTVRILQNKDNIGFAAGNNRGAEAATGDYIAFLNNDTRVNTQWLKELVRPCLETAETICTASKMLSWDGKAIDYVRGAMNFHGFAFQPYQRMSDFPGSEYPLLFACGGAMLIRRDIFLDVGQFDEDYFLFFEDVDLGWRLWLLGHNVLFVPTSIVYHHLHATTDTVTMHQRLVMFERNALVTVLKNYGEENLEKVVSGALLLAFKRAKRLMEASGWNSESYQIQNRSDVGVMDTVSRSGLAVLVAVNEVVEQLPHIAQKRALVQARRKRSDTEIFPLFHQPLHANPIDQPGLDAEYGWVQSQVMALFGIGDLFADLPRRVLVVSSDLLPVNGLPTTGAGLRAWSIGQGLQAQGHEVFYSMPRAAAVGREGQITGQLKDLLWEQGRLADVVSRATPDLLVACGWSTIANLGETTIPVILDQHAPPLLEEQFQGHLDSQTSDPEKLAGLGKVDFFTCADEQQRQYFLPWLARAGFANPETHSAVVPVSLQSSDMGNASGQTAVLLEWRADMAGLSAFCQRPQKRSIPFLWRQRTDTTGTTDTPGGANSHQRAVASPPSKTLRQLWTEALTHLRRGGPRLFVYEFLGFLQRRVQP